MGYYTIYKLSKIDNRSEQNEKIKNERILTILESNLPDEEKQHYVKLIEKEYEIPKITNRTVVDVIGFNPFDDEPTKWYDHENDMREVSLKISNVVFVLDGYGEETGDIWRKYFYNGKVQRTVGKIVFEDFSESKLDMTETE